MNLIIKKKISIDEIIQHIENLKDSSEKPGSLKDYKARDLVKHSEYIGDHLKQYGLKTNQMRKFLDAVKRLKARIIKGETYKDIDSDIIFLKPKLAYAAARKKQEMKRNETINPAQDLSRILVAAIDKIESSEDFNQLIELIEAIVAYHKAAGGTEL
jgi:CRISPR-associated protein Csm2